MSTTAEVAPKREPEPTAHHDSQEEYESAEEIEGDYDEEEVEEIEVEEEVEEEEEEVEEEEDEEGDPDKADKQLDDDEDRKNPQFIPKKGYFYEHDDRTKVEEENGEEEPEEPAKKEEKPKKTDGLDRWTHDKFDESEQAPKSKEELSTLYGYDIRSEDQPPRARRRRRYGRGPTKYTRQWEDEEAYQKPRGGFRGRGRGSRGGPRDRRHDSRDEYDEEFPELGGASRSNQGGSGSVKIEPKSLSKTSLSDQQAPKSEAKEQPRHENNRSSSNIERNDYRRRDDRFGNRDRDQERDHEGYSGRGGRGGRGGGMGSRRGGRRNEFTNRNRYPNRRDRDEEEPNDYSAPRNTNFNRGGGRGSYNNSYEGGRDRDSYSNPKPRIENNNRRGDQRDFRSVVNGTANERRTEQKPGGGENKYDKSQQPQQFHQQSQPQQHRIPPFTNTEYPAPGKGNINTNTRAGPPPGSTPNRSQNDRQNNTYPAEPVDRESNIEQHSGSGEPQKEVRDLREKLNAMRMQKGYQNQNQNDRRSQIPPRLQQQQQQQPPPQQQQAPPPQPLDPAATKPRRYSTQRERTVPQQPPIVTSGNMVIPNTVAPPAMAQGVPNMVPVVTMSEGVVPSTVAAYQPANYYEGSYEASGSPVTGNGPSVSPSLWNPHANAYATAPYPSPPTAPQVPPAAYADPAAFIGPGAPIYAAPPQFLQDPTLMNYPAGPAPPFPPPYHAHPQGFQGYAQVTPAPPPEVYHQVGGVTYYSTQNQIQRPPMMPPQKRPKSVLQLVEPPEKSKGERVGKDSHEHPPPELVGMNPIHENTSEAELAKKLEETTLNADNPEPRKPSPLREFTEETSWAAEMEELASPTSAFPEEANHFGLQKEEDTKRPASKSPEAKPDSSTSSTSETPPAEKSESVVSTN